MANRKKMKHVKASRSIGHRPKKNKKSVAERKLLKRLLARQIKLQKGNTNAI